MADLVFNIRPASASRIRAMDQHELVRSPDGTSAIDLARRHLNQVLHGLQEGPQASLDTLYAGGVKRPAAQAESPYLQVVIGASPGYFRDDPEAVGTWDQERMEAWRDRSLAWLKEQFGQDLVHVALHLDEDTPHLHALIAPTYSKKPRKPGKRKRNETEEEFAARVQAALDGETVRTVGRASHPTLSKPDSFLELRKSLALAVADLGIDYGDDRSPDAPPGLSTREWVRQEAVRLRRKEAALAEDHVQLQRDQAQVVGDRKRLALERLEVAKEQAAIRACRRELQEAHADIVREREEVDQAKAELPCIRDRVWQDARAEGLAHGRAEAREEVEELRTEVRELRAWSERVNQALSGHLRTLRDFIRNEVAAESTLLARARTMFGEGGGFLGKVKELRDALDRQARGYRSGRLGELQKAQDAPLLVAYRRADVVADQAAGSLPERPDQSLDEPRLGF